MPSPQSWMPPESPPPIDATLLAIVERSIRIEPADVAHPTARARDAVGDRVVASTSASRASDIAAEEAFDASAMPPEISKPEIVTGSAVAATSKSRGQRRAPRQRRPRAAPLIVIACETVSTPKVDSCRPSWYIPRGTVIVLPAGRAFASSTAARSCSPVRVRADAVAEGRVVPPPAVDGEVAAPGGRGVTGWRRDRAGVTDVVDRPERDGRVVVERHARAGVSRRRGRRRAVRRVADVLDSRAAVVRDRCGDGDGRSDSSSSPRSS